MSKNRSSNTTNSIRSILSVNLEQEEEEKRQKEIFAEQMKLEGEQKEIKVQEIRELFNNYEKTKDHLSDLEKKRELEKLLSHAEALGIDVTQTIHYDITSELKDVEARLAPKEYSEEEVKDIYNAIISKNAKLKELLDNKKVFAPHVAHHIWCPVEALIQNKNYNENEKSIILAQLIGKKININQVEREGLREYGSPRAMESRPWRNTALHTALETCQFKLVQLLLDNGAITNVQNHIGETALHHALRFRVPLTIAKRILEKDVTVKDIKNNRGQTLLACAVIQSLMFSKYEEILELFSKEDVAKYINVKDDWGNTPIMYTLLQTFTERSNDQSILPDIKKLINMGADPFIKNNEGKDFFELAQAQPSEILNLSKKLQISYLKETLNKFQEAKEDFLKAKEKFNKSQSKTDKTLKAKAKVKMSKQEENLEALGIESDNIVVESIPVNAKSNNNNR